MVCMWGAPRPKRQHYTGSNTPAWTLCLANIRFSLSKASRIFQRTTPSLSWNPPLLSFIAFRCPRLSLWEAGETRWDVLMGFLHDRPVLVASWTSTTLQLATVREPIHLSSTPYIRGSFRVMWLLMKRLKRRLGALEGERCSVLHGIMHG